MGGASEAWEHVSVAWEPMLGDRRARERASKAVTFIMRSEELSEALMIRAFTEALAIAFDRNGKRLTGPMVVHGVDLALESLARAAEG